MSELAFTALGFVLVGLVFCGVYAFNRERLWWAIIPGLGAFTLLAAMLADAYIGTDPANDWASVLVIAGGAALIAAVLKREDAKRVLDIVAGITLLVGILMTPITVVARVAFIAILAVGAAFVLWGETGRRHTTTLRPH